MYYILRREPCQAGVCHGSGEAQKHFEVHALAVRARQGAANFFDKPGLLIYTD